MRFVLVLVAVGLGQLVATIAMYEIGRRLAVRRVARGLEVVRGGVAEAAVLALLGLLVAFTFSGAAGRFDERRRLIVDETNAIGTAYLRLDFLEAGARDVLRARFREYLDARLAVYRALPDLSRARTALARSQAVQRDIWRAAVAATKDAPPPAAMLLTPALNAMFDITTTRTMATQMHPPLVVFAMLGMLVLVSAFFAGYGIADSKQRSRVHLYGFALTLALAVYVIVDLEYPRQGLIQVHAFDQALVDLRRSMD